MEADLREMQENQGLSEIRIDKREFVLEVFALKKGYGIFGKETTFSLSKNAGTYLSELCRNMLRGSDNNF